MNVEQKLMTLTLKDVVDRMHELGMHVQAATVADGIDQGVYPFGSIIQRKGNRTGRRRFVIYRVDFERWGAEKAKKPQ